MKSQVELTAKQEKVLKFIRERVGENLPPTIREIAGEMGFSSTGTVRDYLEALRRKGYLKRKNNKSRAIELLDKGTEIPVKRRQAIMDKITGKTGNLNDLVAYQDGSVVSKEIIKKDKGTVTLFAFDKGQGLSEHTAPFDALVYVFDGKAEISISGKPNHLKAGEMIIMPANQPHALKATERFKMMLVMIRA